MRDVGVPAELKAILDQAAGKDHSATGSVMATLAQILQRHEQIVSAPLLKRIANLERELDAYIGERERLVRDDPELAAQIREGIAQAERGETVDLGSFAQYLDGDDDD